MNHWLTQLFIALDQLANVLLTPFSNSAWADETLSSRAYRAWRDGKKLGFFMHVIDALFSWQDVPKDLKGHCHWAYLKETQRTTLPPEMR